MAEGLIERIRVRAYEIWEGNRREGNPEEHWLAAEREILDDQAAPRKSFNGEAAGREATRAYDDHVKKFGESGQVPEKVKEAEQALDGPEREELKRAEEVGKRRARNAA